MKFAHFLLLMFLCAGHVAAADAYRDLDWLDLLTDADHKAMLNLPEIDHDTSPERAVAPDKNLSRQFTGEIKDSAARREWERVLTATTVRPELNGTMVRMAGYLVPLQTDASGKATEFFLVPYLGACIHIPPPPPNQLVYVKLAGGMKFPPDYIYEAFHVEGVLQTELIHNKVASAAYTMTAKKIKLFQ